MRLQDFQEFSTIREPYVTEVTRAGLLYAAIGEIRGTTWNTSEGAELAASRHGYQAGELTVASLCPYSTGSILAKAWHEGYQKARDEQR